MGMLPYASPFVCDAFPVLQDAYDIRTVQKLLGHNDMNWRRVVIRQIMPRTLPAEGTPLAASPLLINISTCTPIESISMSSIDCGRLPRSVETRFREIVNPL